MTLQCHGILILEFHCGFYKLNLLNPDITKNCKIYFPKQSFLAKIYVLWFFMVHRGRSAETHSFWGAFEPYGQQVVK